MRWLERLRRPGTPPAPDPLAEAQAAFSRGEYATALGLWEPLARAGAVEAQAGIGLCFLRGLGIPADPPLAEKWLALAAAGGHARAQRELATLLRQGAEGVEADPARATGLYRAAAEGGDPIAQDIWSRMLLEGQDGVAMDLAEAGGFAIEPGTDLEELQGSYMWSAGLRIAGGTDEILKATVGHHIAAAN